jgi:hypothetical protein
MATHGNPKPKANGQGGVYRRADGRWEAKSSSIRRTGAASGSAFMANSQRDALDELGKILDQQRRGIPIATATLTVAE